ncbi:nucleotidyltransferase family protein [Candidatus Omnitrophota bacterium]
MKKRIIPNEHTLILNCARLTTSNQIKEETKKLLTCPIDWDKSIELASLQGVFPFLYYTLNKYGFQNSIPQHIFETMKAYYYANIERNFKIENELLGIIEKANYEKIYLIPLRGFIMIHTVYHNPGLRVMDDVDILIKQDQFHKIKALLARLDYKEGFEVASEELSLNNQPILFLKKLPSNLMMFLDVHGVLFPSRPYPITFPVWERVQEININNQAIPCLSQEDMFLCMALHIRRHTRRLTLKFIVDIAELLNTQQDILDWCYINKCAKDDHIVNSVYLALYLAKEMLDTAISPDVLKSFCPDIIKRTFIYCIVNRYNFFSLKKLRGIFLRLLLFDGFIDILLYLWRVAFLERFIVRYFFKKNIAEKRPRHPREKIKK